MHQISSPGEQVGINQHGPLRFGREEILMWLPQGYEEADPRSSPLGISHIPQGWGSESMEEIGAVTFCPSQGGTSSWGVSHASPHVRRPCSQWWEPVAGRCVALLGLQQGSVPWEAATKTLREYIIPPFWPFFPLRLTRPYLSYVCLQFSNPLLYPYLGRNTIFIVAISSLHQQPLSAVFSKVLRWWLYLHCRVTENRCFSSPKRSHCGWALWCI